LDTGNIEEIRRVNRLGLVDGVTTNPTLIAKEKDRSKRSFRKYAVKFPAP